MHRLIPCCLLALVTVGLASAQDRQGDPLPPHALVRLGTVRLRHAAAVNAVAYTGDGKRLLSIGSDRVLRVWDAGTGQEQQRFTADQPLAGLAVSASSPVAAAVDSHGDIQVWDLAKAKSLLRTERYRRPATRHETTAIETPALALSPDGTLLAVGGGALKNQLMVWDLMSGQRRWHNAEHDSVIYCLAFAADGRTLASTGHDGSIRLWTPNSGKLIRICRRLSEPINFIAFTPDGKRLASSSHWEEEIRLWDTATGKDVRKLPGQGDVVQALAFGPDGQTLIVQSYARTTDASFIRQWNLAAGKPAHTMTLDQQHNRAMTLAPDGKTLALATRQGMVRRWDTTTWKEIPGAPGHQGPVFTVAFSPDGKQVATGGSDRSVRLWDAATGKPLHELHGHADAVTSLAFGPTLLAAGGGDLCHWDPRTGKELRRFAEPTAALAMLAEGQYLASGGTGLKLWQVAAEKFAPLQTPVQMAQALCFSPQGDWLAIGDEPDITLLELPGGKLLRRLPGSGAATALACSPDGQHLAAGGTDGIVRLWDVESGKPLRRLGRHLGRVSGLAYSPDGKVLVSASDDGTARWWDAATGRQLRPYLVHAGPIRGLAFSPDGHRLATAGHDGAALIWDVPALLRAPLVAERRNWTTAELDRLWQELTAGHAPQAGQAVQALAQTPDQTLPLLTKKLNPYFTDHIGKLIAELDDNAFEVREQASDDLTRLGKIATPAIDQALATNPSLEMRQRLEKVTSEIQRQTGFDNTPEAELFRYQLPALPCVELLEKLNTPAARQVLQRLANGRPLAPLTDEAKAALERLGKG